LSVFYDLRVPVPIDTDKKEKDNITAGCNVLLWALNQVKGITCDATNLHLCVVAPNKFSKAMDDAIPASRWTDAGIPKTHNQLKRYFKGFEAREPKAYEMTHVRMYLTVKIYMEVYEPQNERDFFEAIRQEMAREDIILETSKIQDGQKSLRLLDHQHRQQHQP
jgi:hypothetical protein